MGILNTALRALIWWDGQTIGTQLFTWRKGIKVGEDAQGNVFYRNKDDSRRWVIYNGDVEATRVSPDWHGWLHHTFDNHPGHEALEHKTWEKEHVENLTGTVAAYAPAGSIRRVHPVERRDYEAWQPE
ncbi:NADH:ubiquinone oxidoreductase subunit NDUFA12 [Celeribacter halophilus]|uniref:NADH:ubiquinone oxidoreductase subunit n=1 Tax=Celeribacter halophilus TaxID=576117 RepID=A0A1I3PC34_9RHOB|nr:NADH:ubiquinone oxidoreductase subunit NDUFA12 [Celeribacter halophilus]PZX14844.1 NADH:ubiquinone oxidoreductase subunit [Celeribacter halophilus]SFJ19065.1 NADH:ubiquinone oxidoreductase subunit [Celeribacter halophilus]